MSIFSPQVLEFLNARQQAQQQSQDRTVLDQAAHAPIPGLTGPVSFGGGIPGLLGTAPPSAGPGLNQIPGPTQQPATQFQAAGPYSQQAMQMAGLLGGGPQVPTPGLGGLLGGPPKGFRIPLGK